MRKGKNGIRRVAALVCSVALFATLLPVQVLATDEGMQEPLTAVTLSEENGEETVSEQGDANSQQDEAVACTKSANCAAETHEEGCPKYEAPAEGEGTEPEVSCTKSEDCVAEAHEEGCPKYVAPAEGEGTEPEVSCTKSEDCAAETHEEGCPKDMGQAGQQKETESSTDLDSGDLGMTVMNAETLASRDVAVSYLDDQGNVQSCPQYETLTAENIASNLNLGADGQSSWYVMDGTVEAADRIEIAGDVHLILANSSALKVNEGIHVAEGKSLTIYAQSPDENLMGKVEIDIKALFESKAAIGANEGENCGSITINGGFINIDINSDTCAAIGGAKGGNGGVITINGGKVVAKQNYYTSFSTKAAVIGGGEDGNAGKITINGGYVEAKQTGGYRKETTRRWSTGAAIGGGEGGDGGEITITGGTIVSGFLKAGHHGAAIGGGKGGDGGKITITGGNVTANASNNGNNLNSALSTYGAAIGGGYQGNSGTIHITGGEVTAVTYHNIPGGSRGACIGGGGGIETNTGSITIEGNAVVTTKGTVQNAGIGGGESQNSGTILIQGDATVNATGGGDASAIGGGVSGNSDSITIQGNAKVTATAGDHAAGIGGGHYGDATGEIRIAGTAVVNATGGDGDRLNEKGGSGIGGGGGGNSAAITIADSATVTATGMDGCAGIGGGYKGNSGAITIKDSATVTASGDTGIGGGQGVTVSDSVQGGNSGPIIIQDSASVTATGTYGAGIGSGSQGLIPSITIQGTANVTATGTHRSAGIGSGPFGTVENITIQGQATVEATGGEYAAGEGGAGIGSGYNGAANTITIQEQATVNATSMSYGAAIGSGRGYPYKECSVGSITIKDSARVTAKATASPSAAIGSGNGGVAETIRIQDNTVVTATSGSDGAAIGSGYTADARSILIQGDPIITATSRSGAAIGTGYANKGLQDICIEGGNITAIATAGGAGIGGGGSRSGEVGKIVIQGDANVTAAGGAGIGSGRGASFTNTGEIILNTTGEIVAYGSNAIGIGIGYYPPSRDNFYNMTVGPNSGPIWMFCESTKKSPIFAISSTTTELNQSKIAIQNGGLLLWHNETGNQQKTNGIAWSWDGKSDVENNTYTWDSTSDDTLHITKGAIALASKQYDTDRHKNYGNWAVIWPGQATESISITPVAMTVYAGGSGNTGVVGAEQNSPEDSPVGFPTPGFTLQLPDSLQGIDVCQDLTLQYVEGEKLYAWKFIPYGEGNENVYRIVPVDGTESRPIRMKFTNQNGDIVTDASFDSSQYINQTLNVEIYGEGIERNKVDFVYDATGYKVDPKSTLLTVRGVTEDVCYGGVEKDPSEDYFPQDEQEPGNTVPGAAVPDNTVFTINGSDVQVGDDAAVGLLFDTIIDSNASSNGQNYTQLLEHKAAAALADLSVTEGKAHTYESRYLDLVDQNNGNVWVAARDASGDSQVVTVYWPLPEGTDKNTRFTLLHFEDLHRSLTPEQITQKLTDDTYTPEVIKNLRVTDTHVVFETTSFSPFVLAWSAPNPPVVGETENVAPAATPKPTPEPKDDVQPVVEVTTVAIPQTGDESQPLVWVTLVVLSGAALAVLAVFRKKRSDK